MVTIHIVDTGPGTPARFQTCVSCGPGPAGRGTCITAEVPITSASAILAETLSAPGGA